MSNRPNLNLASILLRAARAGTPAMIRGQDAVTSPGGVMTPTDRSRIPGRSGPLYVSGAGQFGAGVTLPGDSSAPDPIEPAPLPIPQDNLLPPSGGTRGVTPSGGGYPTNLGSVLGLGPISQNENWLGGRLLGIDPNTGKPIYDPLGSGPMADLEKLQIANYSGPGGVISGQTGVFGSLKGHKGDANSTWVF